MPVKDIDGKLSFANYEDRWTDGLKQAYSFNEEKGPVIQRTSGGLTLEKKFRLKNITQDMWKDLSAEGGLYLNCPNHHSINSLFLVT